MKFLVKATRHPVEIKKNSQKAVSVLKMWMESNNLLSNNAPIYNSYIQLKL